MSSFPTNSSSVATVRSDKQIKEREQKLRTAAFVVKQKEECKQMPQPTKEIISNEQKSGIRKGSNRASTGKVGALLLSVYI